MTQQGGWSAARLRVLQQQVTAQGYRLTTLEQRLGNLSDRLDHTWNLLAAHLEGYRDGRVAHGGIVPTPAATGAEAPAPPDGEGGGQ